MSDETTFDQLTIGDRFYIVGAETTGPWIKVRENSYARAIGSAIIYPLRADKPVVRLAD